MAGTLIMGSSHNIPADVSAIERELRRQWEEHPFNESVIRTHTLNLVIVSRTDPVPTEAIAHLTEAHPCRVIVIEMSADVATMDAHIASSCLLTHTGASCLAREEVRLRTPVEVPSQKLERVVTSLLVPGLPTFLWLRGESEIESPMLIRLSAHCDRIVLDSADYRHALSGFTALQRAISGGRLPAVADMAWSRTAPWRGLTAQFFDSRRCAEFATHIREARIADLTRHRVSSDSLLIAAWLARQLRWQPIGARQTLNQEEHRIVFQRAAQTCEIQFISHDGNGCGLQSLQLIAAGGKEATFSIQQTPDAAGLITTTQLGTQQRVQRTVRSHKLSVTEMLSRELSSAGHDTLYEQVLSVAAEMVRTAS
jgi:glucose-6-phosphate dehydrogenase assembly protein OpcA